MSASFLSRVIAWVIDTSIIFIVSVPFILSSLIIASWSQSEIIFLISLFIAQIFITIIASIYYATTMRRLYHPGQTWGKQLMDIKTVNNKNENLTPKEIIFREVLVKYWLFTIASGATFFLASFLDFILPIIDKKKESLHDKITNTKVIKIENVEKT